MNKFIDRVMLIYIPVLGVFLSIVAIYFGIMFFIKDAKSAENSVKVLKTSNSRQWVVSSAKIANCVIENKDFQKELKSKEKFDYSEKNGSQVLSDLLKGDCNIRTYRTRWPWSKVNATTYSSDKKNLYLNTRKNRSIKNWVNTVIHECLHLVDYSHGSNNSSGKDNSVNYWVGKLSEKYYEVCKKIEKKEGCTCE